MTSVQRFDWPDLGFTGMAHVGGYQVEWHVLEIVGTDVASEALVWWPEGAHSAFPPAEDPAGAHVVVTISVKGDGCANYAWSDAECTHTCDGGKALTAVILRVHEVTAQILPSWSRKVVRG